MKTATLLMIALPILSLSLPATAHPGHASEPVASEFVVSWIGVAPQTGGSIDPASVPDFWKKAFVSKIRITGQTGFPFEAEKAYALQIRMEN